MLGGDTMTEQQKAAIAKLRAVGNGYSKISSMLGLSINTIKSYCRRNNIATGNLSTVCISAESKEETVYCKQCGNVVSQEAKKKKRKFCSKHCCATWWAKHNDSANRKANYPFVCAYCGIGFTAYGNKSRKFCSHACYINSRFGKVASV